MAQDADEQWHYERDGKSMGPIDKPALLSLIEQGVIGPDTLVCFAQGEWIPARKSELSHLFNQSQRTPWISVATAPFVIILALNIIVFLAMVVRGVGLFDPKVPDLLLWGANFGPKTTGGEWWRLLTSTFLHIGLLHLVFNMFVLFQIGPLMQRLLGSIGFTIVYFASGLGGSLASLAWNPYVVSAGASGAIFGLYGALLGYAAVQRGDKVSSKALAGLVGSAVLFIGYNVVYGLVRPGTDMAAHAGGLAAGFVCSLGLCFRLPGNAKTSHMFRNAAVAAVAAILLIAVAIKTPRTVDLQVQLKEFADVEARTLAKFRAAAQALQMGKLKGNDFANFVEKDILPDWVAERDSMRNLKGLPQRQEHLVSLVVKYMDLRRAGWSDLAVGVRKNQTEKVREATKKQSEADQVLNDIGNLSSR